MRRFGSVMFPVLVRRQNPYRNPYRMVLSGNRYRAVPSLSLSLLLAPNANSLHRLYRDRLSKAFLFDPTRIEGRRSGTGFKRESVSLRGLAADEQLKYEDFE